MKRPVAALAMPDIVPMAAETEPPSCVWIAPTLLLVDERYQRNLSRRSVNLIRRIVAGWDWRRFKPPICVETPDGFEVIDGQHTAIAAASHRGIAQIPVMCVTAAEVADRAKAFLGHNRDRLLITSTQMHHAAVAAGDEDALTVEQVCAKAGVRVLRSQPSQGRFKPAETMAVGAIAAVVDRHGALKARQVLQVLAEAMCTPIRAEAIRAVAFLMSEPEYASSFAAEDLTIRIRSLGEEAYREAKVFAVAHKLPAWRALAVTWFKGVKRIRGGVGVRAA